MKKRKIEEEFLDMLSAYQGILHKVSLIYFRMEDDRKDNVQQIVYNMWRSYTNLKDKERIASWIYRIAINTSISKLRSDKRLVRCDDAGPGGFTDLSQEMDRREHIDTLTQAITRLEPIERSVMFLYLEERSYDEISEILGISVSNVGVRISRAKKKLGPILKNEYNEK